MLVHWLFFLIFFSGCRSEWILLPSVTLKTEEKQKSLPQTPFQRNFQELENITSPYETTCPDFHNLTMMSYGSLKEETNKPLTGWEVSYQDIEDLIKKTQNVPQDTDLKSSFVRRIGEKLQLEAERQIRSLFPTKSRVARSKYTAYPSMEGALMTISMLLFGVYVTKLILKLLQSHYAKYNPNIGMLGGIRQPIMIAHHKQTRSIETELKKLHLMHLIDKYNSQIR